MKLYELAFEIGNADYEPLFDGPADELMAVGMLADVIFYNSDGQKIDLDALIKEGVNPLDLAELSLGESELQFELKPSHNAVYSVVYKVTGYMKRYYHSAGQVEIDKDEFMSIVEFNRHLLDDTYEPVAGDWNESN